MVNLRRFLQRAESAAEPPWNGGNASESYIAESTFDTNMVIVLAALLCALLCALGLNSIVRCTLRCRRRLAAETAEEMAARGLKKQDLQQIPVMVYRSGLKIPATECPICLGEFAEGEKVRVLPKCNHGFHVKCIDRWLLSHSSCPNCRHSLLKQPTTSRAPPPDGSQSPETRSEQQA